MNHDCDELMTISAQGFTGLIDGWVETIRDFIEGDDDTLTPETDGATWN